MVDTSNWKKYTKQEAMDASLEYFNGNELQASVFVDKYALRDAEGNFYELTPADMHLRLAREFARIEARYPNPLSEEEIYEYLEVKRTICPQGSPMAAIGNPFSLMSASNCMVLPSPTDSISGIFQTAKDLALLLRRRAGVGLDISELRPEGTPVSNAAGTSTGAWSFADFFSNVIRMIGQGGRRGAGLISIHVKHPDVEKFVTMKADLTKVTGANVSVRVSDDFMRAVENDEEFTLQWPVDVPLHEAKFTRVIRAKELFHLIAEQACKTAEPGLLFWDRITDNLPLDKYPGFKTLSTNPCLAGDTQILTIDGPKSFAELAEKGEDVLVYAVNKETNEPVVRWMREPRCTRTNAPVVEVQFDSGLKVKATPDHSFITLRGEKIQAQELKPGQSISAFTLSTHTNGHLRVARTERRGTKIFHRFAHRMVAEAIGMPIDDEALENYTAAPLNPKIIAVVPAGYADVYNGTVDDVHTYVVVDPKPIGPKAKYTGILSSNCGEVPLSQDSCRLISLYLAPFAVNQFETRSYFDLPAFEATVYVAMRLADDLVDIELEQLQAIWGKADTKDERELIEKFIWSCKNGRRTGLGTHGLGDTLARLCIRYDSDEALIIAEDIYSTLRNAAYEESIKMAKERGPFPAWNYETERNCDFFTTNWWNSGLLKDMRNFGRRNGALLTSAPTGSVSILSDNCSSGIEPVFMNSYTRRRKVYNGGPSDLVDAMGDGWIEYTVHHSNVERWLNHEWCKMPPHQTLCESFDDFKTAVRLPDYFVTAHDISWEKRVEMQGIVSHNTCHSVSSTLNLPSDTTPDVVEAIYMKAWKDGRCKGITVYRDGSREAQVLSAPAEEKKEPEAQANYMQVIGDASFQQCNLEGSQCNTNAECCKGDCLKKTHRDRTTEGEMYKASFVDPHDGSERKVYVYVGLNDDGKPVEVFITDENGHPDSKPYAAALAKMTSLALKYGIAPEEVAKTIGGLAGGATSFSGGLFSSVPDLVSKRLLSADKKIVPVEPGKDVTSFTSSIPAQVGILMNASPETLKATQVGKECPFCGQPTLIMSGGCGTCQSCGFSKCS